MKPPFNTNIRCNTKPSHSRRLSIFLHLVFLTLPLFWSLASGSGHGKKAHRQANPPHYCALCDSLADGNCSSEETEPSAFNHTCKEQETWCYKSEGTINTFDDTGERVRKWKVDRGCAKPYFEKVCVHVEQEDETNFKVCYCDESMCNWELNVPNSTTLEQNHLINRGSRLGALSGLITLSLLCILRWTHC